MTLRGLLRGLSRVMLIGGLSLVAAVGAVEIGVRTIVLLSDEFFRFDPVTGIHHIEGRAGRWVSPEFDVQIRINADGFRDRERTRQKPGGTQRIVVLGDSMTEAFQVPLEETFTARLEQALASRGRRSEVLNMGVSAIGPAQAYLVYRTRARAYAPDVVVLALFMGNDFRNSLPELEGKAFLRYPMVDGGGGLVRNDAGEVQFTEVAAPARAREWVREHVASYRFVRDRVMPAITTPAVSDVTRDDISALYREPLAPTWQRAVDVTLAMIAELDRAVRADAARLIVLTLPAPWEVDRAYRVASGRPDTGLDYRRAEDRAVTWLRERGIAVASAREHVAADIARGGTPYFPRDGHFTAHGHALVAERLAQAVEAAL